MMHNLTTLEIILGIIVLVLITVALLSATKTSSVMMKYDLLKLDLQVTKTNFKEYQNSVSKIVSENLKLEHDLQKANAKIEELIKENLFLAGFEEDVQKDITSPTT